MTNIDINKISEPMSKELLINKISESMSKELLYLDDLFKDTIKSKIDLISQVSQFILNQKRKKIRPILTLLSAKICGGINETTYREAMLVELLHTATLIHDDVVDNAETRRGHASVNAVWDNKIAILIGDYFLSEGLMLTIAKEDYNSLGIVSNVVRRMSEGELLQIQNQKSKQIDIDEKIYFRIISDKTASLLSACCEIGAMSSTTDKNKIANLRDYGEYLGISFQIQDDLLDYLGEQDILGKSIGMDIREKKITLPLIYALNNSNIEDRNIILKYLENDLQDSEIKHIINFVNSSDGIKYAKSKADEFVTKAKQCLEIFPDSEPKKYLLELLDFVVQRNY
jgi:octaprenyl-diphosphate synthase